MKYLHLVFLFSISVSLLFFSCEKDKNNDPCNSDFDQETMFANIADNIILPNYLDLKNIVDDLQTKTQEFIVTPNENKLGELHMVFYDAYRIWQSASQFEFGPAEEIFLQNSLNNFPANISQVEFNVQNETNNFDQPDTYDQGFPALDYLLFGVTGTDDLQAIANIYAINMDAEKYKKYLGDIVNDMQQKVTQTYDKWENGFRNSFVTNTGTAAGSSLSQIINGWNLNYELIKRNKIGTPSGVLDLNFPLPDKVEAYYSGRSVELAIAALEASKNLYLGVGINGEDGLSLDDFLNKINAEKDGENLDALIQEKFANAINAVSNLSDPLSDSIENDPAPTILAYNEITKQVVNIKTDLPSLLCISITYIDNPSDSD